MDWNSLKILELAARHGSLSAAAKALDVNYTTVFRRIESLEKEVGGKLFERGLTRYSPTPLAEELLAYTQTMFEEALQIERKIVGKECLPSGVVKVTAPYNIANRCLPSIVENVRSDFPDIRFEILSSNESLNLNTRVADIAIRATSSPPEHLVGRKVKNLPWAMFTSDALLQQFQVRPSSDNLADFPLIGGAGAMMKLAAFSWLEKHCADSIVVRCDELTAMSNLAEKGVGIAFLPIDQRRSGLLELETFEPGKSSELWILRHPDLRNTRRINIVVERLTSYFENMEFSSANEVTEGEHSR